MRRGAAAAVAQADVLLMMTGAGWSADSGLAVYRDIADQPAYAARGLTYPDLCQPHVLRDDPALFYGFWGACYNDYKHKHLPHEGYTIVQGWRDTLFSDTPVAEEVRRHAAAARDARGHLVSENKREAKLCAFFSFTSNVDAHWTRFCRPGELKECHGCLLYTSPSPRD